MIPYGKHYIDEEDIAAVAELMRKGWLTQGPEIAVFEADMVAYTGARYAVAVASGSAALHLATIAAGVGPGHCLVTSPNTFVASALGALYCGGEVTFTDTDPETQNMSAETLAAICATKDNVKAVIPVHFAGLPCDMPALAKIAADAGAVVIEDAAHALGATYPDGTKVGSCTHSAMTVFSFHPVKAIAAGEGGLITTNDEALYRQLLRLRSHGINKLDDPLQFEDEAYTDGVRNLWYYEMQELGYHYRITDIQCALVRSQLRKLDKFIARRKELVARYDAALADFRFLRPGQTGGRARSGHHIYTVRIEFEELGLSRNAVMQSLRARNIGSQVHYIPVTTHPYFQAKGFRTADYPNTARFYDQALSIPLYYTLSDAEQDDVIAALREVVG